MNVGHEDVVTTQRDLVRDTDVAHVPAGTRRSDGLHHRLLGADRLDHRMRAEAVGEVLDLRDNK